MRSRVQIPVVAPFLFVQKIMLKVSKVLIQNSAGEYLVLLRNNHPIFGNEIDLPGGTMEKGENSLIAAVRETQEECGIVLVEDALTHLITTRKYSRYGNQYSLYTARVAGEPAITLSWEHSGYRWVHASELIAESLTAKDAYIRLAADMLRSRQ